ncbi:hypothetical protein HDU93_003211 [Gonapodya sp. JEL0774]|nr:hypothetical protein HDU93_003211 [Gonapodya sp. JEL0774]
MTAGSGIVHSEMHSDAFQATGGMVHGFQLWVNLPREHKMTSPSYQGFRSDQLAHVKSPAQPDLVSATVISGSVWGAKGPVTTRTPVVYIHFVLKPGGVAEWEVPKGDFNIIVYVAIGRGQVGPPDQAIRGVQGDAFLMENDTTEAGGLSTVTFWNEGDSTEDLQVLLLAGTQLREPVARHG